MRVGSLQRGSRALTSMRKAAARAPLTLMPDSQQGIVLAEPCLDPAVDFNPFEEEDKQNGRWQHVRMSKYM